MMDPRQRLERLLADLDDAHREVLRHGVREVHREIEQRKPGLDPEALAALGQQLLEAVLDLVEAQWSLACDGGPITAPADGQSDAQDLAARLLDELANCAAGKTEVGSARSATARRLIHMLHTSDPYVAREVRAETSRLVSGWQQAWPELDEAQRTVGAWRVLVRINEKLDAFEQMASTASSSAVTGASVTARQAVEIAATHQSGGLDVAASRRRITQITESPPAGLYRAWPEQPAWYVWFLPRTRGLESSTVVVVSKRTGEVLGCGSAGDEG